ncbi:origin recognition complex subunit 3 N-terminus-domain-containing protein, partial [Blyttiomyces helicus]
GRAKLSSSDMQLLAGWYSQTRKRGNLVILVPELEGFDPKILQGLIAICHSYRDRLPIVLVFGLATTIHALHESLPRSVLSLLRIDRFQLQNSEKCIDAVVKMVGIQPLTLLDILLGRHTGLKIGLETYQRLISTFQNNTFSVKHFGRELHFAFMDHYYSNPLCILTDLEATSSETEATLRLLNTEHLEAIRLLPSFQKHIDSTGETSLLLSDERLRRGLPTFLAGLQIYHARYEAAFNCLLILQKSLANPTFRRPPRTLYSVGLRENAVDSEYVRALLALLRKTSLSVIKRNMEACLDCLERTPEYSSATAPTIATLRELIDDLHERFEDSDGDISEGDQSTSKRRAPASGFATDILPKLKISRTTTVSKRTAPVVETVDDSTPLGFVKRVCIFFEDFLRDALRHYKEVPLHEIAYYDNSERIRLAFDPQSRATIQNALGKSRIFLQCACCRALAEKTEAIDTTVQDIAIAYRLHLECGKLINLYDWFVGFGTIVEKEGACDQRVVQYPFSSFFCGCCGRLVHDSRPPLHLPPPHFFHRPVIEDPTYVILNSHRIFSPYCRARFVNAVAEMQFLGLIQPTARKTDHVMRLTWGSM